jgi:threonine dehydrogenase-like Zn-dependent dehydrogenase
MKQLAQYQDGRLEIQEVPVPVPPPGGALVQVTHSVISIGTEKMKVEQAKMNLLQKAMARPDQVRKVIESIRNLGWKSALQKVRNRMESPTPLGYSAAWVVVAVDEGNTRLRVGDRVACAGAECANHAEFIAMPDLLMAKIPENVPNWMAAYSTVLSIAMQALRQGDAKLGEQVLVMGQGLIGLLLTALLHANGVRVMAVDLVKSKEKFSIEVGAERFVSKGDLVNEVRSWTFGNGVDKVYLCTGTQSNRPIEQAVEIMRDRGRLVIVGNTKTDLSWKTYYEKEIDVRYSRSYGPGRYDPSYEWGGSDYPIGYVRWTEQRNLDACLALMAAGKLNLEAITTHRVRFEDSLSVYQELLKPESKEVGVVLEYSGASVSILENATAKIDRKEKQKDRVKLSAPVSQLHVIGAGNFARTMLLPHLRGKIPFGVIVNQTALSANHVKNKFGFQVASTEVGEALKQNNNAAVVIATRHHLHAPLALRALDAGIHVFIEKPLCLTREELVQIDAMMEADKGGTVQVGFNRRFAPLSVKLKEVVSVAPGPKSAVYRVMAGKLDPKHWYANFTESGGRVLGEACHFL